MVETVKKEILVFAPIYNDWEAASSLLEDLDGAFAELPATVTVVFIDDGSTQPAPEAFARGPFRHLAAAGVLRLRRNLGHQRAIAVGLVWAFEHARADCIVLMDGDGEDRPQYIPQLVREAERLQWSHVVFAARVRRLESAWFTLCYHCYRWLHKLLTGVSVRVGNFSVIPARQLRALVVAPELWNHYAASVFRIRAPFTTVPVPRALRYAGRSKMNFVALMIHGLSAMSLYSDIIGTRLLIVVAGLIIFNALAIVSLLAVRIVNPLAMPIWAATAFGLSAVLLLQGLTFALALAFVILSGRSGAAFSPIRDCPVFVDSFEEHYRSAG
jgi:hypothetical protein